MQDASPESPEARALRPAWERQLDRVRPGTRPFEIARRVIVGVYSDGFIHAGNLAYLSLLALFPFFIILAALAQMLGREPDVQAAVATFLSTLPPTVENLLRKPITDVLVARGTGSLLWLGAIVGLWTVGSFIETIRDILRRAYGTPYSKAFWHYRLGSIGIIIVSVIATLVAFSMQVLLTAAEEFVGRLLPFADKAMLWIGISRIAPLVLMALALYWLIYSLTPSKYRFAPCPKWPGALFVTLWWIGVTMALPRVLGLLGGYDLTYGGLAGTIITLLFFWLVGFGLVIGANINAALAETPEPAVKGPASQG
ncbi:MULTISPECIES: YihY/virulence factor BrkB family protein [Sphingomonadales]|uniref:YihY/virulence factor BrkB family protein n=2 Tax=Edaphosphingomonas TaxID=3423724 RepID=A0A2T4I5T3_9SPHN|nr:MULTISPECIES: YihY/virulence factor BrkB family protein [Sphingomonas]AGH50761.1 ribonuclease BN [Sphingomonas sp. MM-1]MDX3884859.1 YihY/virulence factor BrkB family protein [Sphingomonas sp.]OHT19174.1 Ribonuclease BN-like family protein [Sphingomonas haloaromaticamans]PTD25650.1 YihY/virulence factor BrkB family protein [Sphingomonas fennica]